MSSQSLRLTKALKALGAGDHGLRLRPGCASGWSRHPVPVRRPLETRNHIRAWNAKVHFLLCPLIVSSGTATRALATLCKKHPDSICTQCKQQIPANLQPLEDSTTSQSQAQQEVSSQNSLSLAYSLAASIPTSELTRLRNTSPASGSHGELAHTLGDLSKTVVQAHHIDKTSKHDEQLE